MRNEVQRSCTSQKHTNDRKQIYGELQLWP